MDRETLIRHWLTSTLGYTLEQWAPASSDASFRRYFRAWTNQGCFVLMDAPPDKEDVRPFIQVAEALAQTGVNSPHILARDIEQGFLLITDLGTTQYLAALNPDTADGLYNDALNALLHMQTRYPAANQLPPYDKALLDREMALFTDWLIGRHLNIKLNPHEEQLIQDVFTKLANTALEQPKVFVHRDYHSRNLMRTTDHNPGIIDFQDAVFGPITYDVVSLLRDCYIAWPRDKVTQWALDYAHRLRPMGYLDNITDTQFLHWFDWMGIQRHLKASGIFARLYHRDGKSGYLNDIPQTLRYIIEVCDTYPDLRAFGQWVQTRVAEALP